MPARAAAFLLLLFFAGIAPGPASAHRLSTDADTSGLSIPGLTHGQMAVIADYRRDILALAASQSRTDETFRRLLNFANIQYAYCLWGLVPGSLRDEASPFNECSHAYLSAVQAVLAHMLGMSANKAPIEALVSRIDADMVRNQASFVMCRFSGETFNTASIVRPAWRDVPFHPPSLIAFSVLAFGLCGGCIALAAGTRTRKPATAIGRA
jgi:hypothetical protein